VDYLSESLLIFNKLYMKIYFSFLALFITLEVISAQPIDYELPTSYRYLDTLYNIKSFKFGVYLVTPICTGFIRTRGKQIWSEPEPVYIWLLRSECDTFLIDTGISEDVNSGNYFSNPIGRLFRHKFKCYFHYSNLAYTALARLGVNVANIHNVLLTHAHFDHVGSLRHFRNSNILLSHIEYKAAKSLFCVLKGYKPNSLPKSLKYLYITCGNKLPVVLTINDHQEILTDLYAVISKHHTEGHLMFLLKEDDKFICFVGDELLPNFNDIKKNTCIESQLQNFGCMQSILFLGNHDTNIITKIALKYNLLN
jgi:glyoxylase-like metal-dependent hydrolase (beta-lactamase superfamily II)